MFYILHQIYMNLEHFNMFSYDIMFHNNINYFNNLINNIPYL